MSDEISTVDDLQKIVNKFHKRNTKELEKIITMVLPNIIDYMQTAMNEDLKYDEPIETDLSTEKVSIPKLDVHFNKEFFNFPTEKVSIPKLDVHFNKKFFNREDQTTQKVHESKEADTSELIITKPDILMAPDVKNPSKVIIPPRPSIISEKSEKIDSTPKTDKNEEILQPNFIFGARRNLQKPKPKQISNSIKIKNSSQPILKNRKIRPKQPIRRKKRQQKVFICPMCGKVSKDCDCGYMK